MAMAPLLGSCQRSSFQPDTIDQDYITFGKGGGMTNQVDTYYILRSGEVYRHNSLTKEYTPQEQLDKATREECFERALGLSDSLFGFEEPGNLYYFLTVHSDTVVRCTWGAQEFNPADSILSFYQYAKEITKN